MRGKKIIRQVELFAGARVLVAGDVMVDRYYWGTVGRISPEAPVPVVEVTRETQLLGGAANVAANIRALGGEVVLCGLTGGDADGVWLDGELDRRGIDGSGIAVSPRRPTTVKSRIVAHSQQVVRFDREHRAAPPPGAARRIAAVIDAEWPRVDAVVLSDYGKGVVSARLMDHLRTLVRRGSGPRIVVDPKSNDFSLYRGVSVVTPNAREALAAAGMGIEKPGGIDAAGKRLLARSRAEAVLVTRGEEGMSLYERTRAPLHIPTVAREVFDVTGAGDTVVATLGLALAAGADLRTAARLANAAAGIVVADFGTVAVTAQQLVETLGSA